MCIVMRGGSDITHRDNKIDRLFAYASRRSEDGRKDDEKKIDGNLEGYRILLHDIQI